jgi:hypothetical protein
MNTVDYVAYPEYTLVPSNVVTGSMAVRHEQKLDALHAVARDDIGKVTVTACGQPCLIKPEDGEPVSWDQVNIRLKCPDCTAMVGDAPRGPDGRQYYPQRDF